MKIQNENLAGLAAPSAAKTSDAGKLERLSRFQGAHGSASASPDKVDLSGLASGIVQASEAGAKESAARVQALAKTYQAGRYAVEPGQLSRKLVSTWLANGAAPKE